MAVGGPSWLGNEVWAERRLLSSWNLNPPEERQPLVSQARVFCSPRPGASEDSAVLMTQRFSGPSGPLGNKFYL